MTIESLTDSFVQYVSWLYHQRQWAGWELGAIAVTALVLLLLIVRRRPKAKAPKTTPKRIEQHAATIGVRLDAAKGNHQELKDSEGPQPASLSKKDRKKKWWRQTTQEWKNFRTLVEQQRMEVSRYKEAEENFKQQLASLKAANEQLQHELAGRAVDRSDLASPGPLARFGRQQDRMLDAR
jgi:uncharacterized membrane protein YcjF (UPF0283 family)